jgi:hypothetical protein
MAPLRFEDIEIGYRYPVFDFVVTKKDQIKFENSFSIEFPPSWTRERERQRPLSPFLLNHFHGIRARMAMPDGVLHAREKNRPSAPAYPDEQLSLTITVQSKSVKNDKQFVILT